MELGELESEELESREVESGESRELDSELECVKLWELELDELEILMPDRSLSLNHQNHCTSVPTLPDT